MDKYARDAKVWRTAAEFTYVGAYELFKSENPVVWFPASILGHHALELLLKSALIRAGHSVERDDAWGHILVDLARKLAAEVEGFPADIMDKLSVFDAYFDELRYPKSFNRVEGLGQLEGHLLDELVTRIQPFAG